MGKVLGGSYSYSLHLLCLVINLNVGRFSSFWLHFAPSLNNTSHAMDFENCEWNETSDELKRQNETHINGQREYSVGNNQFMDNSRIAMIS